MSRRSGLYRLILVVLVLAFVGAGAYVGYKYFTRDDANSYQKAGEQAYENGKAALEAKDGEKAKDAFGVAVIQTDNALDVAEKDLNRAKSPDQVKTLHEQKGKLLWLKAQILRDLAFANALAEGKEMTPGEDSVTGERMRLIGQVPDATARKCVMEAARYLPRDAAVQAEALRLVSGEPYDWSLIQPRAANIIDNIDKENVRARYYLAKYEFEQPVESNRWQPTEPKNRSRERVEEALKHLQFVKAAPAFPVWRTLYLEAEINSWLAREGRGANKDAVNKDVERLRNTLFDPKEGALARAARQENFKALSKEDIRGIEGLHAKAIEAAIDRARETPGETGDLLLAMKSFADLTENLFNSQYGKPYREELLEALLTDAMSARKVLGVQSPPEWLDIRGRIEKIAQQAVDAQINRPKAYASLARTLNQDAFLEGKRNNAEAKQELEKRALKWIDEGLKLAENDTNLGKMELISAAIEVRLGRKDKSTEIEPYLDALRKMNDPRAKALVGIHEAAISVRQGKLAKARTVLEAVTKNQSSADMRSLALVLLAHVYLATDQPSEAAQVLRELDKAYARLDQISPAEREWFTEFLSEPQDLALLTVVAELETATKKMTFTPDGALRENLLQTYEENAKRAISKLRADTDANRQAHMFFVNYYLNTGRIEKARLMFDALKKDYPEHLDVLRFEVFFAMLPGPDEKRPDAAKTAARQVKADNLIQSFLKSHARDQAAKRFWIEWLMRTNRAKEALAYLNDPANFPGTGKDDQTKRLAAAILLDLGKNAEALGMVGRLPNDDYLELILILATANPLERQMKLDEALAKHENNGLLRLLQADLLVVEKKPDEAAKQLWSAMEFTRIAGAVNDAFLKVMLAIADTDPDKASQLIDQFAKELPNTPVLYSTAAYVAVKRDDFGSPDDVWARSRSMYAALNQWQSLVQKNLDPASIAYFRARRWLDANRPDLAWNELAPHATQMPRNEQVLTQLIELALASDDAKKIAFAQSLIGFLRDLYGESSLTPLFYEARLLESAGEPARAVALLETTLQKDHDEFDVYPLLIRMLTDHGGEKRSAELVAYWRAKQPDNFLPALEEIREDLVAKRIGAAEEKSDRFLAAKAKEVEDSFAKFGVEDEKVKQERRKEVRAAACRALSETWMKGGQPVGAEKWIARWLDEQPNDMAARLLRAQAASDRKDWTKAKETYEAILNEDKNNLIAQVNLAWLLAEHLKQPDEALKIMRSKLQGQFSGRKIAVERLPAEFLNVLGKVYVQEMIDHKDDKKLPEEMEKIFEPATSRYPSDPRLLFFLGVARAELAKKDQANEALKKALGLAEAGKGPLTDDQRKELIQKISVSMKGI